MNKTLPLNEEVFPNPVINVTKIPVPIAADTCLIVLFMAVHVQCIDVAKHLKLELS